MVYIINIIYSMLYSCWFVGWWVHRDLLHCSLSVHVLNFLMHACLVIQSCSTLCNPMDCSCQAPLSAGLFKQEYWNGLPFPPPRDLPDPGTEHVSPESSSLASGFLTTEPPGNFLIVVQSPSRVQLFVTPWTAAHQASLSFTISQSRLKLMSLESVMTSNHLILCCPLLLLPSIFPRIRIFSNESALCIRWPKYWSFSSSISPSNEYSRLISLRIDLFDVLAVQGTLKSLLQHHSSKTSVLWCSTFFL